MTIRDFPERRSELRQGYRDLNEAIPEQMKAFGALHRAAVADGALSAAVKELMAAVLWMILLDTQGVRLIG